MNLKPLLLNGKLPKRLLKGSALAASAIAILLVVISCRSVSRSVVMLPDVPGAKYIGSKECEQCHDKI